MVIAKILGGLGNQLFQYAMGRSLASRTGSELKLDLDWFASEGAPGRSFLLDRFNIHYRVATDPDIRALLRWRRLLGRDLHEALVPFHRKKYIRLRDFEPFREKYRTLGGNVYLEGYWTDERYFRDMSHELRSEFTLRGELSPYHRRMSEAIAGSESVSVHVRRGDYVTHDRFRPIFDICNREYYAKAIDEIVRTVPDPRFFVFSDDIEWARRHLRTGHDTAYVSQADGDSPDEELVLMSLCRHNIIANSTFSWWGAWLNRNEGKRVVAPGKWFNIPGRNGGECVPASWTKIEIE